MPDQVPHPLPQMPIRTPVSRRQCNDAPHLAAKTVSRIVVALLLATIGDAPCRSAEANAPSAGQSSSSTRVRNLVDELNASTLAARTAAEQKLLDLGPEILPHLPAPELLPNSSVRETVRRIRVRLEKTKAEQSIEPSRISLSGRRTLSGLVESIEKQTRNRIQLGSIPREQLAEEIPVDFEKSTFWEAMNDVAMKFQLRFDESAGLAGVTLKPSESSDAASFTQSSGPARISTAGVTARKLVGDDARVLLRSPLVLSLEPRLRPLYAHYAAKDVRALRPDGTELSPYTPEAKYELPLLEGGHTLGMTLDFLAPRDAVPSEVTLRGEVAVLVAAGTELFRYVDLKQERRVARRRAGVTVTLLDVTAAPAADGQQSVKIGMSVSYDVGGPAFESHRQWMFYNDSWLEDSRGDRVPRETGFSTRLQADGGVVVEYEFVIPAGRLSDYEFVYSAPTLLIDVPVRIDLPGIPVASRPRGE